MVDVRVAHGRKQHGNPEQNPSHPFLSVSRCTKNAAPGLSATGDPVVLSSALFRPSKWLHSGSLFRPVHAVNVQAVLQAMAKESLVFNTQCLINILYFVAMSLLFYMFFTVLILRYIMIMNNVNPCIVASLLAEICFQPLRVGPPPQSSASSSSSSSLLSAALALASSALASSSSFFLAFSTWRVGCPKPRYAKICQGFFSLYGAYQK